MTLEAVRRATAADAEELVRLRAVMFASLDRELVDDGWRQAAVETLRVRLAAAEPTVAAFVVDRRDQAAVLGEMAASGTMAAPGRAAAPDQKRPLAACAVGAVEYRIGGPGNHTGEVGYVFSVSTDPDQRRRGYSRRCMTALLDWFRGRGVARVDLRASAEAEPLYCSLGFVSTANPTMRFYLR